MPQPSDRTNEFKDLLDTTFGSKDSKIEILHEKQIPHLKQIQVLLVDSEKFALASKLKSQIDILTQIDLKNEEKKQAALNEEFELAASIKKQILDLES